MQAVFCRRYLCRRNFVQNSLIFGYPQPARTPQASQFLSPSATAGVRVSRVPGGKLLHACKRTHSRVDSPNNSLLLTMKNEMDYELLFGHLQKKHFLLV
jgi:hypothetical protein